MSIRKQRGILRLVLVGLVVGFVWLYVLPRIGESPSVQHRIQRFRQAGINPTAVFYTDHPEMANIERNIAAHVDHSQGAFWKPQLRP
jgi:hypothetical protein